MAEQTARFADDGCFEGHQPRGCGDHTRCSQSTMRGGRRPCGGFLSVITFACTMVSLEYGRASETRGWFALFAAVLVVDALLVGAVF